jgi:hypothetical protein
MFFFALAVLDVISMHTAAMLYLATSAFWLGFVFVTALVKGRK